MGIRTSIAGLMGNGDDVTTGRVKDGDYACAIVPGMALQALLRSEPDYRGKPLAVIRGAGSHARIHLVTKAAMAIGVRPGMTPSQARSVAPGIYIRDVDAGVVEAARMALLDVAHSFSPGVEPRNGDSVILDVGGMNGLYPSPTDMGVALTAACAHAGLSIRIGFAKGPRLARLAAQSGPGVSVFARGNEALAMDPLPLTALEPPENLLARLKRLGIRTVGAFARLDTRGLGIRLGPEAMDLHDLARGIDHCRHNPQPPSESFQEKVALDYSLDNLEPLIFMLNGALDRLAVRIEGRRMAPSGINLLLQLDPDGFHPVRVVPPAPTSDVRSLVALIRLALQKSPPPRPVQGFSVRADAGNPVAAQGSLFGPPVPDPAQMAILLGRLTAIAGTENVGSPNVPPIRGRNPGTIVPFSPPTGGRMTRQVNPTWTTQPPRKDRPVLALRRFLPPVEATVAQEGTRPVSIKGGPLSGKVIHSAGPWYTDSSWWTESPQAGAYYDVEIDGRGMFRMWHDLVDDLWAVEGVYD